MSIYYLIDALTAPLASSRINDVRSAVSSSLVDGDFVVRVSDGLVLLQDPTNLTELLAFKRLAMIACYPGYALITYDDLLDAVGIASAVGCTTGERSTTFIDPGGILTTTVNILPGPPPPECFVMWEEAIVTASDPKDGLQSRTYTETFSNLFCDITFNGWVGSTSVIDGALVNIPLPDQGNNLELRFTNSSPNRILLGSWAVIS